MFPLRWLWSPSRRSIIFDGLMLLAAGVRTGRPMVTRRRLIQAGTVGGAALLVPAAFVARQQAFADPVPGGTLDPTKVPKYVLPLFVLPAMPGGRQVGGTEYHEIAAR